ncbi:Mja hyp1 intein [Thermococcus litoralis DSM 5473]|uniref:Mja hyp1 intein n=2 Tax=Thermococcus litoralis TaxID=2265 RepID=H3ZPN1_THELN|nr:Mja hyp1 intein [Thermococcus litoralis DSM 5473]
MITDADLHIHSRYSKAVSKLMTFPILAENAKLKGLGIVGTGDILNPQWEKELLKAAQKVDEGSYEIKGARFLLTAEVEDNRRVHHLLIFPSIDAVREMRERLNPYSKDIETEGRPHANLSPAEIADLANELDVLIGPAHCVPPDTLLILRKGITKISDVKEGDEVLTHNGRFRRIARVYKRKHTGNILKIKVRYIPEPIIVTPEHPIYAIKTSPACHGVRGICKPTCKRQFSMKKRGRNCKRYYSTYKPEWVMAKDLKIGDVVLFPVLKEIRDIKRISLKEFIDSVASNKWKKDTPEEIEVSKEFCRLVGYFLAEGSCFRDGITFSLSEEETDVIDDITTLLKEIFGVKPSIRNDKRGKGYELKVYSRVLRNFFGEMFYIKGKEKRAWNKQLPHEFLYLPPEKQFEIFVGWWKGDGGVTTSRILMNQMNIIAMRNGFISTFSRHKVKSAKIGKRNAKTTHDRWQARISTFNDEIENMLKKRGITKLPKGDIRYGWFDGVYFYLPIIRIEKEPYDGIVYNLEVEEDSSYVTESGTLHNCFTPWTALYKEYNSLKEAYGDAKVHFLELGLSADSYMADRIKAHHKLTYLSNSDAHSPMPHRLGREFNRFEIEDATFDEVRKAILKRGGRKIILNAGLDPRLGKYHLTACSKCYTKYRLEDAKRLNWRCELCGGIIKKGVHDRILELADTNEKPKDRPPYLHLAPLAEIIAMVLNKGVETKAVKSVWERLLREFGSEIAVLVDVPIKSIAKLIGEEITKAIWAFRNEKLIVIPGGGGKYGEIKLPEEVKKAKLEDIEGIEIKHEDVYYKPKQSSILSFLKKA